MICLILKDLRIWKKWKAEPGSSDITWIHNHILPQRCLAFPTDCLGAVQDNSVLTRWPDEWLISLYCIVLYNSILTQIKYCNHLYVLCVWKYLRLFFQTKGQNFKNLMKVPVSNAYISTLRQNLKKILIERKCMLILNRQALCAF